MGRAARRARKLVLFNGIITGFVVLFLPACYWFPICGDGDMQEGEECDDGNDDERDGCTSECIRIVCNDGMGIANRRRCVTPCGFGYETCHIYRYHQEWRNCTAPPYYHYRDADGDGYGTITDVVATCNPPAGYVSNDLDCDDTDPEIHPSVGEWEGDARLDEIDNDCDGTIDPHRSCSESYSRLCGAGGDIGVCEWGSQYCYEQEMAQSCAHEPGESCWYWVRRDCEGGVRPSIEICDGLDNDCDGETDEACLDEL